MDKNSRESTGLTALATEEFALVFTRFVSMPFTSISLRRRYAKPCLLVSGGKGRRQAVHRGRVEKGIESECNLKPTQVA